MRAIIDKDLKLSHEASLNNIKNKYNTIPSLIEEIETISSIYKSVGEICAKEGEKVSCKGLQLGI